MPLKTQFKLIVSSLIVLLFIPILLYFLADNELSQFIISFSSYFAAVIGILIIYLLIMNYIKHKESLAYEANKRLNRGYFQIEKVVTPSKFTYLSSRKKSKLLVTDNFKRYETDKAMNFYKVDLITEAQMILNFEISIEYEDLSFTDTLYIARIETGTDVFIPQRLSQTVENTLELVELKTIKLDYETLAGEKMSVHYENAYKKISSYGEDASGNKIKLYTEYLNGIELRSLN